MKNRSIKFSRGKGLVPAIIQDYQSGVVYMLGFMNKEALQKTIEKNRVYFWSRSRQMIWMKGEQSGNSLRVKEIYADCDLDCLLVKVELIGNHVCHSGNKSCFYSKLGGSI